MTLAIDKMVSEMAVKQLRGEDVEADFRAAYDALSPTEKKILAVEALQHIVMEQVAADPTLEAFTGEDGQTYIRRAA